MLRVAVGLSVLITLMASIVGVQPEPELQEPTTIQHVVIASLPQTQPQPTPTSEVVVPASVSSAAPTPAPTPQPTSVPTPTVDQAWGDLQPSLDMAWGRDTAQTVALLETFLHTFPDYQPARAKLYAALLASADAAQREGQPQLAVQALERARQLLPDRSEADAALARLTPTPTAIAPERRAVVTQPQPAQALPVTRPTSTPVRAVPTPRPAVPTPRPAVTTRPATVPQPQPTPTKVPFSVPVR